MDAWVQIVVTVVGVLGSTSIWKYAEARLKANSEREQMHYVNNEGVQYRDDLKSRVRNLEQLLANSADEKEELRSQVLQLTAEVHALRVKVEFLEKENDRLKSK